MNTSMIQKKSTMYSVVGSLGLHMLFTLGAGSFLLNINKNLSKPKTYKLEFVKRKAPPPLKKKKIRKEIVRREIKVASIQPKVLPTVQPKAAVRAIRPAVTVPTAVTVPNSAPRQVQRQRVPVMQSAVVHTASSTMAKRATTVPMARSFAPASKSSSKSTTRMAVVHGASHFKAHSLPKLIARSSASKSTSKGTTRMAMVKSTKSLTTRNLPKPVARSSASTSNSKGTKGRITPVQTGVKLASLPVTSPRGVPNIVDRGALKGYLGKVQRIIEGEKHYPEASRKAGREGKLKVQFTIFSSGKVDNIRLLTKTPYANLNREAMDAVKRAAPFSAFPGSLSQKSVQVILPFRFELN